jgi:CRP-like cAMP-binding protein
MALDLIVARLSRLDLLRGLTPEQLQRIARDAERMVFRDGQKIITAGQAGDGAVVIISGRGMIMPDDELGIGTEHVEAGTMLGEGAMLTEHVYRLAVCAVGDVRAIQLTREALLANMQADPDLAEQLRARLANRLQRVALELRLIDERLATAGQTTLSEDASEDAAVPAA